MKFDKKQLFNKRVLTILIVSVVEVGVMLLSWAANFGPVRMILSRILYPVFSGVIFTAANLFATARGDRLPLLRRLTVLSCAVYLIPHLLISERIGGEEYLLFGLIRQPSLPAFTQYIGYAALIISTAVTVLQLFLCLAVGKKER
ncbi:MAG: hypothetical protein ILO42_00905 [Clostridia bacterium]|nr:hypothetical protein [Clostridia bacterium]